METISDLRICRGWIHAVKTPHHLTPVQSTVAMCTGSGDFRESGSP